jgi:hypothetical protein
MQPVRHILPAALLSAAALATCASPAPAAWGPGWDWDPEPVLLSAPGSTSTAPVGDVGPDGDAVVVWQDVAKDSSSIRAAIRPAGRAWQTSDPPLSEPGRRLSTSDVAIDGAGAAVAVWSEKAGDDAPIVVRVATRPPGGPWRVDKDLLSTPGRTATEPQVGVSARGEAIAIWREQMVAGGDGYAIRIATRQPGGDWVVQPTPLSTAGHSAGSPELAVNDRGVAVAIWHEETDTEPKNAIIRASWRPVGGAWQPPSVISSPDAIIDGSSDVVAIGESGEAAAIWSQRPGISSYSAPRDVVVSVRQAGGGWTASPETAATQASLYPDPSVAVDGSGVVSAVWREFVPDPDYQTLIRGARRSAGGGAWETEALSSPSTPGSAVVMADALGDVLSVWSQKVGTYGEFTQTSAVHGARRPAGQAWQHPPFLLSGATISLSFVKLAVNAEGTVLAFWVEGPRPKADGGLTESGGVAVRAFTPPPPRGQERPTGTNRLPSSRINALARRASSSRRRTISGTSRDRDGKVKGVYLAVVRTVRHGRRVSCRALRTRGRWASYRATKRRCAPRFLLRARGTTRWSIRLPRLPRAGYTLTSRALDDQGGAELRFGSRLGNQRSITST